MISMLEEWKLRFTTNNQPHRALKVLQSAHEEIQAILGRMMDRTDLMLIMEAEKCLTFIQNHWGYVGSILLEKYLG